MNIGIFTKFVTLVIKEKETRRKRRNTKNIVEVNVFSSTKTPLIMKWLSKISVHD